VTITNESGSETYSNASEAGESFALIDLADLPTGDNVMIQVNATGYDDAIYYMDISPNNYYTLAAYLVYENATNQYTIQVIDESNEPLEEVQVRVMRLVGGVYENVTIDYTDANGNIEVYLIPSITYKVNLSKNGYVNKTENYIPDPNNYGIYYPKIFKLYVYYVPPDILNINDIIHFNGTINSSGVITIWFEDYVSHTTNTAIYIYEYHETILIWNYTDSRNNQNAFSFTDTGYNTSRNHKVILHLNHSDFGYSILSFILTPLRTATDEADLESYFDDVFGDFELGWVKTFLVLTPCLFFLMVFGSNHVGLGIMTSGMYLGFTTFFLNIGSESATIGNVTIYIFIASMLVLAGILVIVVRRGSRIV